MTLNDAINGVQIAIAAVPNVGQVHAFKRFVNTQELFEKLFTVDVAGGTRILGWTLTRESTYATQDTVNAVRKTHAIVARGYMGISDENQSERVFQLLVEDVCAAIDHAAADPESMLGKACNEVQPASVRTCTDGMFCNYFVHYCEIAVNVEMNPVER